MFTSGIHKFLQALDQFYMCVILCVGCIFNPIKQLLIILVTVIYATIAPIDIS